MLRALHAFMAAFGVALLIGLAFVLAHPAQHVPATRFTRANLCIEKSAAVDFNRAGFHGLLSQVPAGGCRETVTLPHSARAADVKLVRHSVEPLQRASYLFRYTLPADWQPGESLLVYSPRPFGVAWQVRIDGRSVADNLDDWRMMWNRPVVARSAPGEFTAGSTVEVELAIVFEPARGHALSRVSIGPASALMRTVTVRQYLQETMPFASILMLLTIGVFFFCFWWSRRAEKFNLLLTLSCIAWSVFNLQFVLPTFDDAAISDWYRGLTSLATPWLVWLIYLFVLQIDRRWSRLISLGMPVYVLAMTLLMLPVFGLSADVGMFYQGSNIAVAALLALRVWYLALTSGTLELRVISVALLAAILGGAHDVAMLAQFIDAEGIFLASYASLAICGAFLFAVQRRYAHAITEHEQLSNSLAERLAAREAELQANQARVLELERAHVLADERQRLMRDMHDGLGSTLTASLALLEQGNTSASELKDVLRASVDDLRAVIDSLEPVEGELVTLLGTLRFRLGRRLELAGIQVEWDMQDLPALQWLGPPQALQVMRIVQEVLTNVLKHAAASRVRMAASVQGGWIEVRIADNGRGFDVAAALGNGGRGLRNLRRRAAKLQAQLVIDSQDSGTTIRLLLPLALDAAPWAA